MNSKKTSDKIARQLLAVRFKKIEKLKTRVCSGAYKVESAQLAKALFLMR